MTTHAVVCYIRDRGRILLQRKAPGRFGAGYWNGPGGKIARGESAEAAVMREVMEETGLAIDGLREHGTLVFYLEGVADADIVMHVFSTNRFSGEQQANDEGPLEWFAEDSLPYESMWADDRLWVPHVLAGRRVAGSFRFSEGYGRMLEHEVTVE